MIFLIAIFSNILHYALSYPEIHIKSNGSYLGVGYVNVAPIGLQIPLDGVEGYLCSFPGESSCSYIDNVKNLETFTYYHYHFLIVDSTILCSIFQKAIVAEKAGFDAIIIRNTFSDEPIKFSYPKK